jgi:hypothetical protein
VKRERKRFFLGYASSCDQVEREPIWLFSQKETAAPEGAAVSLRQPAVRSLLDRNPDGMLATIYQSGPQ